MNSSSGAFRPPWLPLQSAVSTSSSLAHAAAVVRSAKAPPAAEKPPAAGTVPLAGISNAGDGLPELPSHAHRCAVAASPAPPATFDGDAPWPHYDDAMKVVDVYGNVSSRDAVRQQLLQFYEDTKQIAFSTGIEKGDTALTTTAMVGAGISEMTLRIDTELELLRRQCFAERNAQWNYYTPDMFTYEPVAEPQWHAQQPVGNRKLAWTRQIKQDATENGDEKDSTGVIGVMDSQNKCGLSVGEFARDRPWPPKEFTQKANTRPSRARGGKRKAPAAVMEEKSVFSRLCAECQTQTTPLWRKVPREAVTSATATTSNDQKKAVKQTTAILVDPAAVAQPMDPLVPSDGTATSQEPSEPEQVDVCLTCYLKLQRRDVFERKKAEKTKQAREKKERLAAQALAEKKRLKQQIQLLKKQQVQAQALAKSNSKQHVKRQNDAEVPVPPIKIMIKAEAFADQGEAATFTNSNGGDAARDSGDEHDSKDNVQWLADASATKRKDKKKSKKDKKKKKKKSSSKKSKTRDAEDEDAGEKGEDDDDNVSDSDSGMPAMPPPPQREGSYEHADRASRAAAAPSIASDQEEATRQRRRRHEVKQEAESAIDGSSVTSSSRTRKGRSESVVSVTTSIGDAPPAPSSSRKRKSSIVAAVAASDLAAATKDSSSARASRSKATPAVSSSTAATPLPVVVVAPPRKRVRAKKETARERELRALGQYCPVCNLTYEEDDESSFVCCDSCEMWVHGACDTALTSESIAALAESSEKYICPLCAGR
uniref:PHD-type domain-containing protein n=1 Tax=Globisporangium ultimum (strain ATCC 200006 / CBS 805.95 / DAOM BR144) TaxID=431595 RepID=K3X8X5_GLOUD